MRPQAVRHEAGKVYAYDMLSAPWTEAGRPGFYHKAVRGDRERGLFLGLLAFDPLTRTGVHQHLGVAASYFLDGSLVDYWGPAVAGQAGINLKGATHDAISYGKTLLAARLEAPVLYRPDLDTQHEVHTGARHAAIINTAPEVPPDINITVDAIRPVPTRVAGLTRRLIYDYHESEDDRRFVQLAFMPGTRLPAHLIGAQVEWFVLAGDVTVNAVRATGGNFVVMEPGTEAHVGSEFGALVLAWADGPAAWADGAAERRPDLYGF